MPEGSPGAVNLDVLPVFGPEKSGKSTLIEHVCNDERVRNAFSQILLLSEENLHGSLASLRDVGTIKHQNHAPDKERVLVIVEIHGDIASKRCAENGTKIIISSRSDKIARFGTTRALKVEFLRQEAWKSSIPPYYSYIFSCEIYKAPELDVQKKHKACSGAVILAAAELLAKQKLQGSQSKE
ncbi:hypothetical protein HU200_041062 [Digitaria exilis]|uniref:Uncharacterized protein n=1 Tax=Digitaria exilis TaxID=1010633 RepID=A0A835BDG8_9POAL|nr:hypothetical protein HU200_041062 [Digitaria exilis]